MSNVPDDWNAYYYTCSGCGARCHASEYGCDCGEGNVAESNRPRLADSGYELEDGEWKKLISDTNHTAKIGHNLKHCGDGFDNRILPGDEYKCITYRCVDDATGEQTHERSKSRIKKGSAWEGVPNDS